MTVWQQVALMQLVVAAAAALGQDLFDGVPYERLRTRQETEARMTRLLLDLPAIDWGPWYLLSPFPGSDRGMLAVAHAPERELPQMTGGGPGPDLRAEYVGRDGVVATWRRLGVIDHRPIELKVHGDDRWNVDSTCYLYRRIEAEADADVPVMMGSDDGLRVWLNGRLLVDADVPRGLDPEQHRLKLPLAAGVNHLLCKVTQGQGAWQFQFGMLTDLDPVVDARLQAKLTADFPTAEDEYYRPVTIPVPREIVLEVGGLDVLPDGRPIVCTRRGDVYIVSYTDPEQPFDASFTRFASGLHEPLGLAVRQDADGLGVYCVQRGELTRLVDTDGNDRADRYETVCDAWGVSGNYHEFAFGPKFDAAGNAWITLNVGFCGSLGKSTVPYRGWAVVVDPGGAMTPVCDGLRSPNGIGFWRDGTAFYVDNQGDYVGTCKLARLAHDLYHGHPASLSWREGDARFRTDPPREPAAVWFPYRKMGQSTADIVLDTTGGAFGPFSGQMFVGDQTLATVMRVDLEVVDGRYQGACFPFRRGLDCGVNRLAFDADGGLLIGQTDRGWGSIGRKRYGLQRLAWTGHVPFEILHMRATTDGFVLEFTADVDARTAIEPRSYRMVSYTYEYHREYGSDERDRADVRIVSVEQVSARSVRLRVEPLRAGGEGFVHELRAEGVRDVAGRPLLHPDAYYTMQVRPSQGPG